MTTPIFIHLLFDQALGDTTPWRYREAERGMGGLVAMKYPISVGEVKDLGDGKYSVRLKLDTAIPEVALSQTEIVSADGCEAAVEIAKQSFARFIKRMIDLGIKKQAGSVH